ncbi:ribonuclease N [Edwardsiella hoshinae]|uniref:Ribonuclease n=1 Tax=Edwardsiella hoshinae TaxID=93378 RepID=A0A376D9M3_9GAMM|nr:ribonuclease domain-containing protein [Edwardsiella hoshinae]AOV95904.1 ribonuclease N [Edwardsiella hoshinae]QPR28272.1 ribonuclease N [Edwardsiella hoshinae]STC84138.1 Ribonuclease precursor [Edwardsiella hoshinae]
MNKWLGSFVGLLLALGLVVVGARLWAPGHAQDNRQAQVSISQLTRQERVVAYLRAHRQLPDYYITKRQARAAGWDPAQGNLCQVLPGRAIGGDRFANREGRLPQQADRIWREADVNYRCGRRQADRVLYSNDGLIYVTRDHYRHFIRME